MADAGSSEKFTRIWRLTIGECPDLRLAVRGLPIDREERLSLVMRLKDLLDALVHADDVDHEGSGVLWQRYARVAWPAWQEEVTVERVQPQRTLTVTELVPGPSTRNSGK